MSCQDRIIEIVNNNGMLFKDITDEQKEFVMKQIIEDADEHGYLYTRDKIYVIREL